MIPYLAYGSNLLTSRLAARCPSARVLGLAEAPGHALDFSKRGRDGSAKATITESDARTQGVLFEITETDIPALDAAEGAGLHYEKIALTLEDGQRAFTYRALQRQDGIAPFEWYLALIRAGRREHGLGLDDLADVTPIPDPEPDRPGFIAAREALVRAGYRDWRAAL
ncbi:gamma-glutamylcyclotransferase family protein [Thioclava electrotropha]|uniref:Gamma-glutamylcyclotransferase n=1 Tax=Thioclava electrotropha TaxID=1549850 RepID=A0ABX6YR79_9RHOB|nr:gamma-glutamylcyclotransferase family protein [Thioclava electrotropha]QPZ90326.1 gamma-glutamylcyclotransferase [Thioclava electrotropha]